MKATLADDARRSWTEREKEGSKDFLYDDRARKPRVIARIVALNKGCSL